MVSQNSKFVLFENSGHFAPVEEPEAFKAKVYEFLGITRLDPAETRRED